MEATKTYQEKWLAWEQENEANKKYFYEFYSINTQGDYENAPWRRELLEKQQQPEPVSQQVVSETKITDTTPMSQVPSVGRNEVEVSVIVSSPAEHTDDDEGSRGCVSCRAHHLALNHY